MNKAAASRLLTAASKISTGLSPPTPLSKKRQPKAKAVHVSKSKPKVLKDDKKNGLSPGTTSKVSQKSTTRTKSGSSSASGMEKFKGKGKGKGKGHGKGKGSIDAATKLRMLKATRIYDPGSQMKQEEKDWS